MHLNRQYSVSVVIPTHNRPLLARRAVASALAQTINNIEIIVVDDCSDQMFNVQEIILSLGDDRITYIRHNVCMGPSATRNTGIDQAQGEFIAFLDDDDIWMEDKLESQIKNMNNSSACICGFFTQYGVTINRSCTELGYKELKYERDYAINSGLLVRSDVIENIRYDNHLRVGETLTLYLIFCEKEKSHI
jgi:glycosyltransferase involved in cell wall biosynthesis